MAPTLSILIASLAQRAGRLTALVFDLESQRQRLANPGDVEILTDVDHGEVTIGSKRNRLLDRAAGEYVAFVDDDDRVAGTYLRNLQAAARTKADCLCFPVVVENEAGVVTRMLQFSLNYPPCIVENLTQKVWPNHLCGVRRELALQARFDDSSLGEDTAFARRLHPRLKSEAQIHKALYVYQRSAAGASSAGVTP